MNSTPQAGSVSTAEQAAPQRNSNFLNYLQLPTKRARLYYGVTIALALWFVGYVFLLVEVLPTAIYWLSYYAVDYRVGFVRRGLAGQVIAFFPDRYYLPVAFTLMWGSFAAYCGALAVLARHIMRTGTKSERRIVVSLLVPVLPFAVTFAIFGPRPELYAASALIVFGIVLTHCSDRRAVMVSSALFGIVIAALAFVHELMPLEFAFGAVLAISVLALRLTTAIRWVCMVLAAGPGLIATAVIVLFGRRDVGAQICDLVPHHMLSNPFQVPPDKIFAFATGRYQSVSDYHDWVCHNIVPYFDADVSAWFRSVANLGFPALLAGFVHGLLVCVVTLWLIHYFTGVSWKDFIANIQGGIAVPLLALALMIPVFVTGVDWIRWWTVILINVAAVYLIFAAGQPGIEKPVANRQVKVFVAVVILLALVPLSSGPGYFTGWVTV